MRLIVLVKGLLVNPKLKRKLVLVKRKNRTFYRMARVLKEEPKPEPEEENQHLERQI